MQKWGVRNHSPFLHCNLLASTGHLRRKEAGDVNDHVGGAGEALAEFRLAVKLSGRNPRCLAGKAY